MSLSIYPDMSLFFHVWCPSSWRKEKCFSAPADLHQESDSRFCQDRASRAVHCDLQPCFVTVREIFTPAERGGGLITAGVSARMRGMRYLRNVTLVTTCSMAEQGIGIGDTNSGKWDEIGVSNSVKRDEIRDTNSVNWEWYVYFIPSL